MKFVFTMNVEDIFNIICVAVVVVVLLIFAIAIGYYELRYKFRKWREKKAKERGERLERKK